jgi:hypothetical protein
LLSILAGRAAWRPKVEDKDFIRELADRLLSKYVSVWLWTILFGTDVGVTYSSLTYYSPNKWGFLGLFIALLLLISLLASLVSWLSLLQYLSRCLLPRFFYGEGPEIEKKYAESLGRAFRFLIVAFLARGSMTLVDLLYSCFFRF